MFFFKTSATANYEKKIYDFSIESITGETINFKDYNLVTLDNPKYLNAEDDRTLLPLEAAIDLAILDNKNKICVLRGSKVKHNKYLNRRS